MDTLFDLVAGFLNWIASLTGFSYNEINIIAYYVLLPFVYVALIDRILHRHLLKILYAVAWTIAFICIPDFSKFSDWLFDGSARFLMSFGWIGWDYVAASVYICVIFPLLALAWLLPFAFPRLRQCFKKTA